jgi:hypothetical protein
MAEAVLMSMRGYEVDRELKKCMNCKVAQQSAESVVRHARHVVRKTERRPTRQEIGLHQPTKELSGLGPRHLNRRV